MSWEAEKWCWRKNLESLVGYLQDACKVVPPGRAFLRRISNHLQGGSKGDHHIRLNREFRADLRWWQLFLCFWNGKSFIQHERQEVVVISDASGSWGCGAHSELRWLQLRWPVSMVDCDIAVKEMIPIVLAVVAWGPQGRGSRFRCYSDNQAVVAVVESRQARDKHLLHLVHCLCFFEAHLHRAGIIAWLMTYHVINCHLFSCRLLSCPHCLPPSH